MWVCVSACVGCAAIERKKRLCHVYVHDDLCMYVCMCVYVSVCVCVCVCACVCPSGERAERSLDSLDKQRQDTVKEVLHTHAHTHTHTTHIPVKYAYSHTHTPNTQRILIIYAYSHMHTCIIQHTEWLVTH